MNIAKMIKEKRSKLGISYRQLSEQSGVSHTYIRDIEQERYAPSFENAAKICTALDLDMKDVIIQTYQAHIRLALFELIEISQKYNADIPYEDWVKTNLPLQPLGIDKTKLQDAAFEIITNMYQENRSQTAENKLELMKKIAKSQHDPIAYNVLPDLMESVSMFAKARGVYETKKEVNAFTKNLVKSALKQKGVDDSAE